MNRYTEGVHSEDERALRGRYLSISNEAIDWSFLTLWILVLFFSSFLKSFMCHVVSADLSGKG